MARLIALAVAAGTGLGASVSERAHREALEHDHAGESFLIKTADHVIDIGPDGGHAGGRVIATGTPEEVAAVPESYTGQFLVPLLPKAAGLRLARSG